MKVFAVVLAILAVVYAAEDDNWAPKTSAELKSIREACVKAHPIAQDLVNLMLQFEYPDEEAVRQCLLCSVKKIGLFCACKGFDAARLAKQYEIDVVESTDALDVIQECSDTNKNESSIEDWVYRGYKCLISSKVGESMKTFVRKTLAETA